MALTSELAGQQVTGDRSARRRNDRVVWITGYLSAGKTTVGRLVEAELRGRGHSTMFLDGDDLRSIFSGRWGYSRTDRVELVKVYFRLCSHLASQGDVVVIAAVAMYREASHWLHENVPGVLEVFLDVPESERRSRDEAGKNVYAKSRGCGDVARRSGRHRVVIREPRATTVLDNKKPTRGRVIIYENASAADVRAIVFRDSFTESMLFVSS